MSLHHSTDTRAAVAGLLDEGLARAQVAARLGISKATVSYHAKRLGRPGSPACGRRYDWAEVQAASANAARRGAVAARPQATPLADMLVRDSGHGRWNLKRRLIAAGLKQAACEECGLTESRGRPITLELHHRNGALRRQPAQEPRDPLPQLPQPDGELRRPQPGRNGGGRRLNA